jgi:hypothetical protein
MVPHASIHQRAHRLRAALRSLHPSSVVAVTLALLFGGTTIADAANGGNFLLGKANTETATATLTNTKGTPLKLAAPSGHAPLAVTQKHPSARYRQVRPGRDHGNVAGLTTAFP